ncbi:MAG: hypothetical protein IJ889_01870 [Eubacterium sp.]|nr:hypothetical protein [Eubacterium sp.]
MIKKISLFLVLVLMTMCFYNPTVVDAKIYETEKKHIEIIYPHYGHSEATIYIDNAPKGTEIKNFKIKNTKICSLGKRGIEVSSEYKKVHIDMFFKKPGKTSIKGDIYHNGNYVKTFKTKIVTYKYKNPFKKVKLYGKNYAKKFKHFYDCELKPKRGKKSKISVKVKKGWKFLGIRVDNFDNGLKEQYLGNNSTIKFTKRGEQCVNICLLNKKYNNWEWYEIFFY